jgi:hypothetical protein
MIPKIIYYQWTGKAPLPDQFKRYIEDWSILMPDYQIVKVTLDDNDNYSFVKLALLHNKPILATGYIRLRKLFQTGGILLDTDIEVIKKLDDLLINDFFTGYQGINKQINQTVMGAVPEHRFIKQWLDTWDNINWFGTFRQGIDIEMSLQLITDIALANGWVADDITQHFGDFTIYKTKYFYPYLWFEKFTPDCITDETFTIHHWSGLWQKEIIL